MVETVGTGGTGGTVLLVPLHVQGQVVRAGEGAVTEVALEGFRAGVLPGVPAVVVVRMMMMLMVVMIMIIMMMKILMMMMLMMIMMMWHLKGFVPVCFLVCTGGFSTKFVMRRLQSNNSKSHHTNVGWDMKNHKHPYNQCSTCWYMMVYDDYDYDEVALEGFCASVLPCGHTRF